MTTTKKRETLPASDTLPVVAPTPSAPAPVAPCIAEIGERAQRTFAEREAKEEASKVYQLALWPDDKRAMPSDFIACALFAGIQGKDAVYVEQKRLASINGLNVIFTGRRLTQVHADVWEGIMHLARKLPEGSVVRFRARELLRLIGRQTGKKQRDELRLWLDQLTATSVVMHDEKNKCRFRGSLLPRSAEQDGDDDTVYIVDISRELAKAFAFGFSIVDWEQRHQLQRKPLALWLQRYFTAYPKPVTVAFLHQHSGSKAELKRFRYNLRIALAELATAGGHVARIGDDDIVRLAGPALKAADKPSKGDSQVPKSGDPVPVQAVLPALGFPVVTPRALDQFKAQYPNRDVQACLADWLKWPGSGKATNPDAAFLGFAKKWGAARS